MKYESISCVEAINRLVSANEENSSSGGKWLLIEQYSMLKILFGKDEVDESIEYLKKNVNTKLRIA